MLAVSFLAAWLMVTVETPYGFRSVGWLGCLPAATPYSACAKDPQ